MENKNKTLIERFGFKDSDLTTPEHDKILLEILKNPKQIIQEILKTDSKTIMKSLAKEKFREYGYHDITDENAYAILKNESVEAKAEYPIMSGYYNVGFVDCKITFILLFEVWSKKDHEHDFKNNTSKIISKPHMLYDNVVFRVDFFIEIKPQITSIGELIRQINLYRSHEQGYYVVVTKTTGLKDVLNSQNIFVYEVSP